MPLPAPVGVWRLLWAVVSGTTAAAALLALSETAATAALSNSKSGMCEQELHCIHFTRRGPLGVAAVCMKVAQIIGCSKPLARQFSRVPSYSCG
jgi:hypothetical protein